MTDPIERGLWEDLESNPWLNTGLPVGCDLIGWRHMVVLMLREVDPDPVMAELPMVIEVMAAQTQEQLGEGFQATGRTVEFTDWHSVWSSHFTHWIDPVRQLVERYCATADAQALAGMMQQMNGIAFFDFVLSAYERQVFWPAALRHEPLEGLLPLNSFFGRDQWPYERLSLGLYAQLAERSSLEFAPAPESFETGTDFNRLFALPTATDYQS